MAVLILASAIHAQVTLRVSLTEDGRQARFGGILSIGSNPVVSRDGRYVAFESYSPLVADDTNAKWDIYLRDRLTGTTERVSVTSDGSQVAGSSDGWGLAISPDGRFVVFGSLASDLVPGDTNSCPDVFVRDRRNRTTERVSVGTGGTQGNSDSDMGRISDDGRYVAFESRASNLVPGDTNADWDVFVRDRIAGTTERVSVARSGAEVHGFSGQPSISSDGRYVAFSSTAPDLVPGDSNGVGDVFVRDRWNGTTDLVSVATGGGQANQGAAGPVISGNGRFVAFTSFSTNLVPRDTNGCADLFVRDLLAGTTERVNVATNGGQWHRYVFYCGISADGRFVAFEDGATYVRDRLEGTTKSVSLSTRGATVDGRSCSISADGRCIAFASSSSEIVAGDTNGYEDMFVKDLAPSGFTSVCQPGVDGVRSCPCGNPAVGEDRGCDNSDATGGASLSASGAAYLSMDDLVFLTTGETAAAQSTLFEGSSSSTTGFSFGQGVRCTSGSVVRLITKRSRNGGIRAPDFEVGDPSVSVRSASSGVVIQPGRPYFYFVAYRDPIVSGGCPVTSTFNTTQAGQVVWWP